MSQEADTPPTVDALAFLVGGLREAKPLFENGANGGREGVIHAVETVLKVLVGTQKICNEGLQAPLARLLSDLLNLDEGATSPLLTAKAVSGRSRRSPLDDGVVGCAVFTARRLEKTGLSTTEAREAVAKELNSIGVEASRGRYKKLTARTIRGWCENVDADLAREREETQTYHGLQTKIREVESLTTSVDARRIYLQWLNESVAKVHGGGVGKAS